MIAILTVKLMLVSDGHGRDHAEDDDGDDVHGC